MQGSGLPNLSSTPHRRNPSTLTDPSGPRAGYTPASPPSSERKARPPFSLFSDPSGTFGPGPALVRAMAHRVRASFRRPLVPAVLLVAGLILAYSGVLTSSSSRSRSAGSASYFSSLFVTAPKVDLRAVLGAPSAAHAGMQWTDGAHDPPIPFPEFMQFGSDAYIVELETSRIIETRTGEPMEGIGPHQPFNLGVLKLPKGSKWGFLGVARGPGKHYANFVQVNGFWANEQSLIM